MRSKTGTKLMHQAIQALAKDKHEEANELVKTANIYLCPARQIKMGAGNEALPQQTTGLEGYKAQKIKNTLEKPAQVHLDASQARMELLQQTDVLEMALDAAESIDAQNSVEKMISHQLAACHSTAMRLMARAPDESDTVESARLVNASARLMSTFQQGLLTLQKLRAGGRQIVTVQHVKIDNSGGQALVTGSINKGGGQ